MKRLVILLELIILCIIYAPPVETCNSIEITKEVKIEVETITKERKVDEQETIVEYEEANYIWNYLKNLGYSDYVTAGILGNIMAEVGGNTLNINPTAETNEYYGICQWRKKYFPDVVRLSLEDQCNFLRDNIEYEICTFHPTYSYKEFLNITDIREAALVFAEGYERCNKNTYILRQDCAEIAYNYFVDHE